MMTLLLVSPDTLLACARLVVVVAAADAFDRDAVDLVEPVSEVNHFASAGTKRTPPEVVGDVLRALASWAMNLHDGSALVERLGDRLEARGHVLLEHQHSFHDVAVAIHHDRLTSVAELILTK